MATKAIDPRDADRETAIVPAAIAQRYIAGCFFSMTSERSGMVTKCSMKPSVF